MNNYIDDIPADFARRAFDNTSFSPERRGSDIRRDYVNQLMSFRSFLEEVMEDQPDNLIREEFERYRERTRKLYIDYLSSHSRLASAAVVGFSKFPTARMQKRENATHNKLTVLLEHDEKARKSITKRYGKKPENAPIMSGDADALERLEKKLTKCKELQAKMKAANAAIRKAKGDNAKATASLLELGFTEEVATALLKGDYVGRLGFPDYALTNNNAEIHRLEKRIKQVSSAREMGEEETESENGVRVVVDNAANRVRVYFPDKPDADTRAELKHHGFRWSPREGAWQAYINLHTLAHSKTYLQA